MTDKEPMIEFEDLFKSDREKRLQHMMDPDQKNKYTLSILVYFIVMFIVSSILYILIFSLPNFQTSLSEDEALIEALIHDSNGIVFLSDAPVVSDDYVLYIGIYEGFDVYIHAFNTGYDVLIDDLSMIKIDVMDQILNADITTWSNAQPVTIYKGQTQVYTFDTTIEFDEGELISSTTILSAFGLNVLNFLTYIILLPWIMLLLKVDLFRDLKLLKGFQTQWLSLIVTGYLFVILGNLISNGLSQALSLIFGVEMQQAVNQMIIVRSLNAPGMPLMLISAIIIGPIVEELVFRKAMFGLIGNVKIAMVVSSFTFGAIHLIGEATLTSALINGISYIVMGFVFGYIYLRSHKNIWIPIAVHVMSNLIAIVAILFLPI